MKAGGVFAPGKMIFLESGFLVGGCHTQMSSVFLLVLGAYALHTCLRERLRNASARARLSLVAPTRAPTQENCAPLFSSSSFAMPSQSLSDTDAEKQIMWKMIAPPKRDNMIDFPGIPFAVALTQHLSSVFLGGSGPIHYLRAYAKAYASLRGLRGVPTGSQVSFQAPTYAGNR